MRTFLTMLATVVLTVGGLYLGGGLSDGATAAVDSAVAGASDMVAALVASAEPSDPVPSESRPASEGGSTGTTR